MAVTLSRRYQITIPRDIRQRLKLSPGQKFEFFVDKGLITLVRVRDIRELRGFMKGINTTVDRDEEDRV
jgi:AbrB family looped-hinge helix DNA binding protein